MKESEREFLQRVQRELRTGTIDYDRLARELSGNPDYHRHADSLYRAAQINPERMAEIWSNEIDNELEKARKELSNKIWEDAYEAVFNRTPREQPVEKPKLIEPTKSFADRMAEKARQNSVHAEMMSRAEADGMIDAMLKEIESLAGEGKVQYVFWVGDKTPSVDLVIRKLKSEYSLKAQLYCDNDGKSNKFGIFVKWGNAYHEKW